MRTDTNRQWTTYRILDATIDNPDLADPFTVGAEGAGKDFILHATANSGKLHWDEDANVLYIIATTMLGYGSQFQFTPGGVGEGTGISFYAPSMYIRASTASVLDFETTPGGYLHMVSKVVLDDTIELSQIVTPSAVGEMSLASDNRIQYCVHLAPVIYKVPFYNATDTGDVTLPTGVGLQLGNKLRFQVSTVVATILGETYLDSNDNYITYSVGGGLEYKCAILDNEGKLRLPETNVAATVRGQIYLDTDNRITYSPGSDLEYKVLSYNDVAPYVFNIPADMSLHCGYFFKLWNTLTLPTEEGQLVWRTNEKRIVVHNGTTALALAYTTD